MYQSLQMTIKSATTLLLLSAGLFSLTQIQAGTIAPCDSNNVFCSSNFAVSVNGQDMSEGSVWQDGIMWKMPDGSTVTVSPLSGNADATLNFGIGASTGANGATFSFNFDLPIALQGPINANSSVSYSLTADSDAGAQIAPTSGNKIVSAFEVDTDVGGLASLNKGVDVGDTFFFTGGPQTQNSAVFTASNTFTGDLAYDLMNVKVNFSLSANSSVGISGFVQQTPVPVPTAVWLFGSGLLGLVAVARRRKQ